MVDRKQLGLRLAKLLDGLLRNAEQVGVYHELAPHLHIGGRTLFKRAEVAQPIAQRLAVRNQVVAIDAAARHVVTDESQRQNGGDTAYHRQHIIGHEPNHHGYREQRHGDRPCPTTQVIALLLEEAVLVRLRGQRTLPILHRVYQLLRMVFAILLDAAEPQRVLTCRHLVEQQPERRLVDRVAHGIDFNQLRDIEVVHGLHAAMLLRRHIRTGIDADGTSLR